MILAVTVAETTAYFGDEESGAAVMTTGAVDITISPAGETVSLPVLLEDIKPCITKYITINITNEFDSNPIHLWKKITNVNTEENNVTEPEQVWYDQNSIGPEGKNDIDTVIDYDITGLTVSQVKDYYIYLGQLEPDQTIQVVQSYHMKDGTENWAQSDKMNFTLEFLAQQISAPSPADELPGYEKP